MTIPPASGPITMAELATRLERAARTETFALNDLEFFAAKEELERQRRLIAGDFSRQPEPFAQALSDVKRQAMALAMASKIAEALRVNPDLALGLGISAETIAS